MPEAIATGIRFMIRSKTPENPATVISRADTRKAPIASGIVALAPAPISSAAPGVDQAVTTGVRQRSDRPIQVMAMPRPSAHIQEPICSALAPIAAAPWNTITAELVKPTSTVTKPATTVEGEKSPSRIRPRLGPACPSSVGAGH